MTKTSIYLCLGALAAALAAAQAAQADPSPMEVRALLHKDFHAKGQATMSRVDQDDLQFLCTVTHNKPSAKQVKEMEADQHATIVYPADGKYMGDWKKGQKIAEMGSTDADQVKLHFEIRRQGKPVDPTKLLPAM